MKKRHIFLILLAVITITVTINRISILERILPQAIEARFTGNYIETLEDGLHMGLCGSGGPMPSFSRSDLGPALSRLQVERLLFLMQEQMEQEILD